ncbi:unnamed protein product [Cunninghamella echinulata]
MLTLPNFTCLNFTQLVNLKIELFDYTEEEEEEVIYELDEHVLEIIHYTYFYSRSLNMNSFNINISEDYITIFNNIKDNMLLAIHLKLLTFSSIIHTYGFYTYFSFKCPEQLISLRYPFVHHVRQNNRKLKDLDERCYFNPRKDEDKNEDENEDNNDKDYFHKYNDMIIHDQEEEEGKDTRLINGEKLDINDNCLEHTLSGFSK